VGWTAGFDFEEYTQAIQAAMQAPRSASQARMAICASLD
jgi:hypothetical protein